MVRVIASLLIGLSLSACGDSGRIEPTKVDTIFYNGKIVTLDRQLSMASTVVVDDGRILTVGGDDAATTVYLAAIRVRSMVYFDE